jgi:uncharacterized protein
MSPLSQAARGPLVQLVLQPTRFCNIDCSYCYLPDRTRRGVMSEAVLSRALAFVVESGLINDSIEIRWHAGEPLVAGRRFFADAHEAILKKLGPGVAIEHSIQTNATLLDADWCDLFKQLSFRVGVSIDGPRCIHDKHRRTRKGSGTFDQVMQGIAVLREVGLPFETISVVTPTLLAHSAEFLDFMEDLRPAMLGLNVEETEGPNQSSAFEQDNFGVTYRSFVHKLMHWEKTSGILVREFFQMRQTIMSRNFDQGNPQNTPWKMLTLDVEGNLYTFSPELAGLSNRSYKTFSIGNVLTDSTDSLINSHLLQQLKQDIAIGVQECKCNCAYFQICGGGAPVNKLYENGTFASSTTNACRHVIMTTFDAVLIDLENQRRAGPP